MKIDFKQLFYDIEGKTFEQTEKQVWNKDASPPVLIKSGPPLSLGELLMQRMLNAAKDENNVEITSGQVKFRYFTLAATIRDSLKPGATPPDFHLEDLTLFKGLMSAYPPIYAGQAWMMLEGKPNPFEPVVEPTPASSPTPAHAFPETSEMPKQVLPAPCPDCGCITGHFPSCPHYEALVVFPGSAAAIRCPECGVADGHALGCNLSLG